MNEAAREPKKTLIALACAALVMLVCLFGHLGAIGLVGPDEPRYAWIARAMASTGDWVTPRLYGQPWFEKPVLYYWAAALGFLLHLPAEWAARLPSAFAALAAAIAIGWLGWKFYGGRGRPLTSSRLLAPLIFSTSVAAIGFARAAGPDMLFAATLTLAIASAAVVLRQQGAFLNPPRESQDRRASDSLALAIFGGALGLAVLAKGPAAVVLAGGAVGMWALATRRWREALRLAHPVAIAAFCVVALPWYVLCAKRNPDFLRVFIFQHNFERYLTPIFQHRQPFWYFVPISILGLLPWTACLWPAMQETLQRWRDNSWKNSPGLFFACWAVFPLFFFSFSQSKLPGYILPAIPPLALLIGIALHRRAFPQDSRTRSPAFDANIPGRWAVAGVGVTWILFSLSAAVWMRRLPAAQHEAFGRAIASAVIVSAAGGIAILVLGLRRKGAALLLSFFLMAFFVELAGLAVLPALDPFLSARVHGNFLSRSRYPDRVFTYHLARSWQYGLNFYLQREIPEWSPEDARAALVLTTPQGLEEIRKLGRVQGTLEEPYKGIVYVPIFPAPR